MFVEFERSVRRLRSSAGTENEMDKRSRSIIFPKTFKRVVHFRDNFDTLSLYSNLSRIIRLSELLLMDFESLGSVWIRRRRVRRRGKFGQVNPDFYLGRVDKRNLFLHDYFLTFRPTSDFLPLYTHTHTHIYRPVAVFFREVIWKSKATIKKYAINGFSFSTLRIPLRQQLITDAYV